MDNGGVGSEKAIKYAEGREYTASGDSCCGKFCKWLKDNLLLLMIICGVILGLLIGFLLKLHSDREFTAKEIAYISFPGVIFLNMLKMLILPLVFTSVTAGLAVLDTKNSGRLGGRTVLYYICTTIVAVILGIILVVSIKPGQGNPDEVERAGSSKKVQADDAFMDLIRNIFPPNLVAACFEKYRTDLVPMDPEPMATAEPSNMTAMMTTGIMTTKNGSDDSEPPVVYKGVGGYVSGSNILGFITFAIVFGVTISKMGRKGVILIRFFVALNDAIMRIVWLVMWYSPFGIMFLIMGRVLEMDDWSVLGGQLGMYMVTVISGLLIHGLIILPLLYLVLARKNPITFIIGVLPALFTAFGTASSSATLPVTIRCLEEKLHVDKRVTQFVLPVGATINMDGTALYEAVAAIFIAQVNNYDLDIGQYITISITATLASIGAAGIPEAGLVTMVLVLTSVGLPAEDVTLIIVIDWLIDRIRTAVNVLGDSTGAGIIDRYTRHDLHEDGRDEELAAIEAGDYYDEKARHNYGYTNDDHFDTPL